MHHYFRIQSLRGSSLADCALLVHRSMFSDFADPDTDEWRLVRNTPAGPRIVGGGPGKASDCWLSPSGRLFVVGRLDGTDHGLHVGEPRGDRYDWSTVAPVQPVGPTRIAGVWGLDDDLVFGFGGDPLGDWPDTPDVTWSFDGAQWRTLVTDRCIQAVHGPTAEAIFAVGWDYVACWEAGGWRTLHSPGRVALGFVHAVSRDEVYAASFDGELLQGSAAGWRELPRAPYGVTGLTKWQDRLVVANESEGFLSIENGALVPFQPFHRPSRLRAAGPLMWVSTFGVTETKDFVSFSVLSAESLEPVVDAEYFPY